MGSDTYADVVERLFKEFEQRLPLPEIARLVGDCRQRRNGPNALDGLEDEARRRLTILALVARPAALPIPAQRGARPPARQVSGVSDTTLASA